MKNRLTSPVVWLSVIAQVAIIITLFKPEWSDTFKVIATAIVEICTIFGILNNPTERGEF